MTETPCSRCSRSPASCRCDARAARWARPPGQTATSLRVRVELADIPGALAGVTTALAALGVDVAGIDVLEVDGSTVVDEMLLRVPGGTGVEEVVDVLRTAGALEVLSSRSGGPVADPTVRAFDLVRAVLGGPGEADLPGEALAGVAYADVGALLDVGEAQRFPLARRAMASGVPASGRAGPDSSPLALARGWVLWVAPQVPEPLTVAVVGRRLDVRFAATEAARLRAFATLVHELKHPATH